MENTQLTEQKQTWNDLVINTLNANSKALPSCLNKERFAIEFIDMLKGNPALAKNKTAALTNLMKAATLGLSYSSKDCWAISYGSDFQFQVSYQGMVKLCKRYSPRKIKDIYAKVVRTGDDFAEEVKDGKPSIDFKPVPFNDGNLVGVFAVCLYEDGGMVYETMSTKEVMNVKKRSKTGNSPTSPWNTDTAEMYKKTAIRRLAKHISIDFELAEQQNVLNEEIENDFTIIREEKPVNNPFEKMPQADEVVVESVQND